jgi:5'-3' exonuclease
MLLKLDEISNDDRSPVEFGAEAASAEAPLYLIDASVFIFRAFYSVPLTLTDAEGQPVNAVHGFGRFIGDLIESESPLQLAVAFDQSLTTSFRNELYPRYKANREPAPVELQRQFAWCREFCSAYGIVHFSSSHYEADDLIGTLAARARARRQRTVVVTRDKDLSQLIRPGDVYWDYIGERRYRYDEIPERFGVRPERMADFLALTGDAVDNVPGVPGIGKKTASQLLSHFESLEHLYDNLDAVLKLKLRNPGFVVAQLRDHRELAFLARRLTAIFCEAPIDAEFDSCTRMRCGPPDLAALDGLCDTWGFGRLLRNQAERIAKRAMATS